MGILAARGFIVSRLHWSMRESTWYNSFLFRLKLGALGRVLNSVFFFSISRIIFRVSIQFCKVIRLSPPWVDTPSWERDYMSLLEGVGPP